MAYRDAVGSVTPPAAPQRALPAQRRLPPWAVAEGPFGVRLFDVGIVVLVIAAIEVNVIVGNGPGAVPLDLRAYMVGALLAIPILFRHRWPFQVMTATAAAIFFYYIFARRNISPAPLFFVPLYDAAVAGYLIWAGSIAAGFMLTGLIVVEISTREKLATLASDFLSQVVILVLAVALGELVRSRRDLAAETARRLQLAEEERAAEAGRVVAEERLRIARELHDTVAHSMATITVQAGSALHLLGSEAASGRSEGAGTHGEGAGADADKLRAALAAIRETSKGALIDMRSVLGQLRGSGADSGGRSDDAGISGNEISGSGGSAAGTGAAAAAAAAVMGLGRLAALRDAVTAAGATVTVSVEGEELPLSAEADHSAYRILQESLTNVLRHAGPGTAAQVCLHYQPEVLTITVTDDGQTVPAGSGAADRNGTPGHGIRGMRERAALVGGELTAGPLPDGGFQVRATLPVAASSGESAHQGAGVPARRAAEVPAAHGESS
ncbi:MAG: sensor histidine kinase [Streptosporangiaceae bacterium]